MLKKTLTFLSFFLISFFLLSIPISGRTLFSHLFQYSSPYSNLFFYSIKNKSLHTLSFAKEYTKKLFFVSLPEEELSDTVDASYSALKKDVPWDEYTDEEKELLRKILSEEQEDYEANDNQDNHF